MAFSKEWVEKNNLNIVWDFIILDEINQLELSKAKLLICDGFKLEVILKDFDGKLKCYLTGVGWIEYNNINNI